MRSTQGLALAAATLLLCACTGNKRNGTLRGVNYEVELPGSYSLVERNEREQVWVPSDDDRPFVSIQVKPRPRRDGEAMPCDPGADRGVGMSEGGFYFVRKGDSVDLVTAGAPHGVALHTSRCIPPGEEALSCNANYADGEMPADRKAKAESICKTLTAK